MMVKKLTAFCLVCAAAAVLAAACGVYTFNPAGKSEIKTIAVERFENNTGEYGLADRMVDIVIDAFIADGNMKVVSADKADAVLYGVLKAYQRKPYTYDQNDQVQEYQVVMNFDITLKNPRDDSEIWKETMNQTGIYDVLNETEEDGQNRALGFLVESIINRTTKSW
ncbi:MAG: LPS assembly lipoprotein LptE [candidate division Zixibacteria bacterium]|nr:LPS assembly lipoprotein LptE [candidate division Zixibacteria bacterium]